MEREISQSPSVPKMTTQPLLSEFDKNTSFNEDDSSKFNCNTCQKTFRYKAGLKRHIIVTHNRGELKNLFKCNLCEKRFYSNADLNRHSFVHNGVREFSCSQCSESFYSSNNLMMKIL